MSIRETFSNSIDPAVINDINSFLQRLPYCLTKHRLKRDFLDIYLTTFSESVISENEKLWGSSFFFKMFKI